MEPHVSRLPKVGLAQPRLVRAVWPSGRYSAPPTRDTLPAIGALHRLRPGDAIRNVTIVFKIRFGYDSPKLIESVRGRVGVK